MSSGQGIRAGRAFVELGLDDNKFREKLRRAEVSLRNFGTVAMHIGAAAAKAAASILAPMTLATRAFMTWGDRIAKSARAMGLSTEAFSALEFAATRSGGSVEDLTKAFAFLARRQHDAAWGSKEAEDAFAALGVTAAELKALSPEDQFLLVADRLGGMTNATERAGSAFDIFGRSATNIIPLLMEGRSGIEKLMQESESLGGVLTGKAAAAAEILQDCFTDLWTATRGLAVTVGEMLAPYIAAATDRVKSAVVWFAKFVERHHDLIEVVAIAVAGIAAFGGVLLVAGGSALFLAKALGLVQIAMAAISKHPIVAVVTLLLSGFAAIAVWCGLADDKLEDFDKKLEAVEKSADKFRKTAQAAAQVKFDLDTDVSGSGGKSKIDAERRAFWQVQQEKAKAIENQFQREMELLKLRHVEELRNLEIQGASARTVLLRQTAHRLETEAVVAAYRKRRDAEAARRADETARAAEARRVQQEAAFNELADAEEARFDANRANLYEVQRLELQLKYEGVELKEKELELEKKIALVGAQAAGLSLATIEKVFSLRKDLLQMDAAAALKGAVRGTFMATNALSLSIPKIDNGAKQLDELKKIFGAAKEIAKNTKGGGSTALMYY